MIMGTTKGQFVDEKEFWPIFERAAKLDVPVYHPSVADQCRAVREAYFKDEPAFRTARRSASVWRR